MLKATTWCLGEDNTPSWQAPELEEKFSAMPRPVTESVNGASGPRAAVRDGEDQIPVLTVAGTPSWTTYQYRGAPEDDTPRSRNTTPEGVSPTSLERLPCYRGR